jgi:hypothetical protein
MATCLNAAINNQKTIIPINVFTQAILFFRLILEEKTGNIILDHNPEAQSKAYVIAIESLKRCESSPNEARQLFQEFLRFLETLEKEPTISSGNGRGKLIPPLNQNNRKTAAQLRDFFDALKDNK